MKTDVALTNALVSPSTAIFVTMSIDQQRFGVPVESVRDVLRDQRIALIPKSQAKVAGSINLRGRIVTVVDLRQRLGLSTEYGERPMFVVVEHKASLYSLLVDKVGEVLTVPPSDIKKSPPNLASNWQEVSSGICRLKDDLLLIIDVHALLAV